MSRSVSRTLFSVMLVITCALTFALTACSGAVAEPEPILGDFDVSLPDLSQLGANATSDYFYNGAVDNDPDAVMEKLESDGVPITGDGWYPTLIDNFDYDPAYADNMGLNPEIWTASVHGVRWPSQDDKHPEYACYWCPDMVSVSSDGTAVIRSEYIADHDCEVCNANAAYFGGTGAGRYTGGFETRIEKPLTDEDGVIYNPDNDRPQTDYREDEYLFRQAFGYYETRVRFPRKEGMWSAFWLQSSYQRMVNGSGTDGTEIDVFESAFLRGNDDMSRMGHALLWDGYAEGAQVSSKIFDLKDNDLYDGDFHTFALLWTPQYYVFYVDGDPMWATDDGGVAQVREFLRFTCEIDAGDAYGPHGQKIGDFSHDGGSGVFEIDYVRVYQNINWLSAIAEDSGEGDYSGQN